MWKFLWLVLVIAAWLAWLRNRINDLVAIRQRFGLSLRYAKELLDEFQARR